MRGAAIVAFGIFLFALSFADPTGNDGQQDLLLELDDLERSFQEDAERTVDSLVSEEDSEEDVSADTVATMPFTVTAITADVRYADTTDTISVQFGHLRAWTPKLVLGPFKRGETVKKTFQVPPIAFPLDKARVVTSGSNGWKFQDIYVETPHGTFRFTSDGSHVRCRAGHCNTVISAATKLYKLSVETAASGWAGTKNKIQVSLGRNGRFTPFMVLGSFVRGDTARFTMYTTNLSPVNQIRFLSDGTDGWIFSRVLVSTLDSVSVFASDHHYIKCQGSNCHSKIYKAESIQTGSESHDSDTASGEQSSCQVCTHTAADKNSRKISSNFEALAGLGVQKRVFQNGLWTNWIDCGRRAPIRFEYTAMRDCGCKERESSFFVDQKIPRHCQQRSTRSYGGGYDRGHLVPANHVDFSQDAIHDSNYITNILPQNQVLNRGAWLQSENLIECLRDTEPLYVVGGAVWNKRRTTRNKVLEDDFGVLIPHAFWKVVVAKKLHPEDNGIMAWWFPNDESAVSSKLDSYIISISELEKRLASESRLSNGKAIPEIFSGLTAKEKAHKPASGWQRPQGCSLN